MHSANVSVRILFTLKIKISYSNKSLPQFLKRLTLNYEQYHCAYTTHIKKLSPEHSSLENNSF